MCRTGSVAFRVGAAACGLVACALAAGALAACGPASETPDAPPSVAAGPRPVAVPPQPMERPQTDTFDAPAVVFDTVVFDTVEPPPARPPPAPAPDGPAEAPPATGPSGSCDVRASEAFCFDYEGAGWSPQAARDHCARAPGAAFSAGACPEADRVGTCTFERPDAPGQTLVYAYYAPYPVDLARLACPGAFETASD